MRNKVLLAVIFLDPRYKIVLSDEQCTEAIDHLIGLWFHLKHLEEKDTDSNSSTNNINSLNIEAEDDSILNIESDGFENCLKEKENINVEMSTSFNSSQTSISTKIETILKSYIEQSRLSHKINILIEVLEIDGINLSRNICPS